MCSFIGRHVKSLGKKYDVIDLKQLPDEVHSVGFWSHVERGCEM